MSKPTTIELTPSEVQSGFDRVRWAELLIRQLPDTHEGRNSWLLNYGRGEIKQAPTVEEPWISIRGGEIVGTPFGPEIPDGKYKRFVDLRSKELAELCEDGYKA